LSPSNRTRVRELSPTYRSRTVNHEPEPHTTEKQRAAAKHNIKKAAAAAQRKRTIANMPATTRTALGKQGAAVAQRKRCGGSSPKTRAELYEEAKRKNLPGRSKMGRAELARALGHR
jgi:hypothetical protein